MHRFLASILESRRAAAAGRFFNVWREKSARDDLAPRSGATATQTATPAVQESEALGLNLLGLQASDTTGAAAVPHLSAAAASRHPMLDGDAALSAVGRSSLRMRTEPGDIRHAVISGRLSEVCALLEQLVAEQANSHDFAATMH
jgi:hypothetical protein